MATNKGNLRLKLIRKDTTSLQLNRRVHRSQVLLWDLRIRASQISVVKKITSSITEKRYLLDDAVVDCIKTTDNGNTIFVHDIKGVDLIRCFENSGGKTGFDMPFDVAMDSEDVRKEVAHPEGK